MSTKLSHWGKVLGLPLRHMVAGAILLVLVIVGFLGTAQQQAQGPLGDYGDAPDGDRAGYQHGDPTTVASFPSVYLAPFDPSYVLHRFPTDRVLLGQEVTQENNALVVDRDLDDGWIPGSFLACSLVELEVFVTVPANATAGPLYLNTLFDWNHDGRWSDFQSCTSQRGDITTAEWVIQNLKLHEPPYNLAPGFSGTIRLPQILTGSKTGDLWTRLTISTEPVDEDVFVPAGRGGRGWNGQGDFIYGESEDYYTCVLADRASVLPGCPPLLSNQPPLDPTPGPDTETPNAQDDAGRTAVETAVTINVLGNDSDPNGDPIRVVAVTQPTNGSVTINPDGTVRYTPKPGFIGTDIFTYTICDSTNRCDTATVTVEVFQPNRPPDANNDAISTFRDEPIRVPVLGNDTDPDNDKLDVKILTAPGHGSVTINPDGTITYTPEAGYTGIDSFTYEACDEEGLCSTATVDLFVLKPNGKPEANNDSVTIPEDGTTNIDVKSNDSDPDGNAIQVVSVTQPAHGTVTINPDNTIRYVPDPNYNGPDSFEYQICDNGAPTLCDTATVNITVTSVNDAPVANNDSAATPEDTSVVIDVPANDTDVDGNLDLTSVSIKTGPSHGTVTIDPVSGKVTYTPTANYNGPDSFTYEICDSDNICDTATVNVTVNSINDGPVANNDTATTPEDTAVVINVPANDTDVDGNLDLTSVGIISGPSHGSVSVNPLTGKVTYTPAANYNGPDSFTYEICDSSNVCDTATVSVTVTSVNDAPVANNDSAATLEDTAVVIDVPSNDTDVDGNLDLTSVSITSSPLHGSVSVNPTTGKVTYTPTANYNGPDSFTYEICDSNNLCDTATVSIAVGSDNDGPVANNDSATTNEDTAVVINVPGNDTDPEGGLDLGSVSIISGPANGTLLVNPATGQVTYTPTSNYNGSDSFVYQICDDGSPALCDTATVNITVNAINDAPVANNDSATTPEDTAVVIDVPANDTDVDGNLDLTSVSIISNPSHGSVSVDPTTGKVTYTPTANYNGPDSFTYEICDSNNLCDTATVNVTVNAVNDGPVANDDTATTAEDTSVVIDVPANDTDVDGNLDLTSVSIISSPSHGSVSINPTTGKITYTPTANYNGPDSFTYEICDSNNLCDTATVNVTVNAVNDGPVANDDTATTPEDTAVVIDVPSNDTDVDGNLDLTSVSIISSPLHGSVSINPTTGKVTYTPDGNYNGPDSFEYQICDTNNVCDTATVNVTVNAVNDGPVANNDSATTPEDTAVLIDVPANDTDVDGNLDLTSVGIISGPSHGSVSVNPLTGKVTYTPEANYNSPDSFTYEICDSNNLCDTATVSITVGSDNDAPVANNDTATTNEDTAVVIDVPANDTDVDGNLDLTSVSIISNPSHGSVSVNPTTGKVTYTPDSNYNGPDSFEYQICDTNNVCDTATVNVTVNAVNDGPVANNDTATTPEDTAVVIDVPANDTDVDGNLDLTSVSITSNPAHGTVTVNGTTGEVTYTPAANYNGPDSFAYEICDTNGLCDTAVVSVTVNSVNDAPVANDDTATTPEDTAVVIDVPANDTDVDGNLDLTSVSIISNPSHGSVSVNPTTGKVTYTPTANYNGPDSFEYQICDTNNVCDTATVNVTVNAVNDVPVANNDSATTPEDTAVVINVPANDTDVDGNLDLTSVSIISSPSHGSVSVNPTTGAVTYTPNANYNGPDSFEYQICDTNNVCDTATVNVTVNAVNDGPVANNDSATTQEDTAVVINVPANDTDVDGNLDLTSVSITSSPLHGSVSVNPTTGAVTYTPTANYNGPDSFEYQICDTNSLCDTATVNVTISPVNDGPVANNDTATTPEDTAVVIDVPANDTDVDGNLDLTSVSITSSPLHGSVSVNPTTGKVTYTPTANYNGPDSFEYQICDTNNVCDTATVSITVGSDNDGPVANNDSATTPEDTAVVINVPANDTDVDGNLDLTSVSIISNPAHGTVTVNGTTGEVTYTPAANYNGPDSFTYEICDTNNVCDTATVNVTINPVNDGPVANNDSTTTSEDTAVLIDVPANDTDVDGNLDLTSVSITSSPLHGSVSVNPTTGAVTYTPTANYNGPDSFEYQICDTSGLCDTAVVSVTMNSVNDGPVANNDSATTSEDTSVLIDVPANDTDVDGNLDLTSVSITSSPLHGSVSVNPTTGKVTYTPSANYNGLDSFEYQICDTGSPVLCDSATVNITINAVNDGPVANNDSATTNEDTAVVINVPANDTDVDGNLDLTSVSITSSPLHGSVSVNPTTGAVTYTPATNYNGPDSFEYQICDTNNVCDTATVNVTINAANDAPVSDPKSLVTLEDTPVAITLTCSDIDGDSLSFVVVSGPANGTLSGTPPNLTYTPNANYSGSDSFTYKCNDGQADSNISTVSIGVIPVNDAPVANNDSATTNEDTAVVINVPANDTDVDGNLDLTSVSITSSPLHGSVSVNPTTGAVTYTPNANYNGSDTFDYQICDTGSPVLCDTATVNVTINPVNDAPVAQSLLVTTNEDTPVGVTLSCTDVDGDPLSFTVLTSPTHGTLSGTPPNLTYTPAANYNGPDSFTYKCNDGHTDSNTATVSITVNPVNDPPLANANGPYSCTVGETVTLSSAGSYDPDGTIVQYAWDLDNNGSFETIGQSPTFNCTATGTFTVALLVTDNEGAVNAAPANATVTVTGANNPPQADNLLVTTSINTAASGSLPVSDPDSDPLTCTLISAPLHGTVVVNSDCTFTYTPNSGYTGSDEFQYQVSDGRATDTGLVLITVNDNPVTLSISKSVNSATEYFEADQIQYTVSVTNSGPGTATGISVSDLLPATVTYVSSTASAGTSYNSTSGLWTIGTMTSGSSATLVITATINSGTNGSTITNTATITACSTLAGNSCTLSPSFASATITVSGFCGPSASWTPHWSPSGNANFPGNTITLTLDISNSGGSYIRDGFSLINCSSGDCALIQSISVTKITAPANVTITTGTSNPWATIDVNDQAPFTVMTFQVVVTMSSSSWSTLKLDAVNVQNKCKKSDEGQHNETGTLKHQ